ncbi:MAG TPA: hypothetical protein VFZ73_09225 [Gemmatimonadaceae bacterium]
MTVRLLCKIFLLNVLTACGAAGSDAVFTKGNPKIGTASETTFAAAASKTRQPARPETRSYAGYFRRLGDDMQFQPCGTRTPLEVFPTGQARASLRERFRWNAVWEGARMFAVLHGATVTDTPSTKGVPGDTTPAGPRTRFWVIGVDSLRTWRQGDCGGMRIP